ncbi:hypothetical protein ACFL6L_01340 [candidate division KSB1 bacterium]
MKCPHCGLQQTFGLENAAGEVTCTGESCAKPFYISSHGDLIIHTHPDKDSAEKFLDHLKNEPDLFAQQTCPYCGKQLAVRNYARKIGRVIDNNCASIIYINVGAGNDITISTHDMKQTTIFDEDFGVGKDAEPAE